MRVELGGQPIRSGYSGRQPMSIEQAKAAGDWWSGRQEGLGIFTEGSAVIGGSRRQGDWLLGSLGSSAAIGREQVAL